MGAKARNAAQNYSTNAMYEMATRATPRVPKQGASVELTRINSRMKKKYVFGFAFVGALVAAALPPHIPLLDIICGALVGATGMMLLAEWAKS